MKRIILILLALVTVTPAFAQPRFRRQPKQEQYTLDIVRGSLPDEQIVRHKGFTASYNQTTLIPNWVAYELTAEEASATDVSRTDEFLQDPSIKGRQADPRDYSNSGYDRGHMAAAADMKWDRQAMVESFYMTNTCPQNRELNGGLWLELEQKCRYWAKQNGRVWIVCGPLDISPENGEWIGQNRVYVPTGFFKCVCMQTKDGRWTAAAFIFPNLSVYGQVEQYTYPVQAVEAVAGISLFDDLPLSDVQKKAIKSSITASDWSIPGWKKR